MAAAIQFTADQIKTSSPLKKRILIVDDEAPIRMAVRFCLELDGCWEVLLAATGSRGLEIVEANPLDVILLDIIMPEMDGFAFLRKLRLLPAKHPIPVILLTATAHLIDPSYAEQLGVVGIIPKPFKPLDLAHQILEFLQPQ